MMFLWRRLPRGLKHRAALFWYDAIGRLDRRGEVVFLNHGYAADD